MKKNIVFYLSSDENVRLLFDKEVVSTVPENCRIICNSLKGLTTVISQSIMDQYIYVVLAGEMQDLMALFTIRDLLKESKLILILPDDSDRSVELGHRFYPRYSVSVNSDFSNTAAVLAKMAGIEHPAELAEAESDS